jgi:hypothetical protein
MEWARTIRKACEHDRAKYSGDPVIGTRMKTAMCVKTVNLSHPSAKDEL